MIFAVDHPLCAVWNQKKTQILIEFLDGTKKVQLLGKNIETQYTWDMLINTNLESGKELQIVYRLFLEKLWFLVNLLPTAWKHVMKQKHIDTNIYHVTYVI